MWLELCLGWKCHFLETFESPDSRQGNSEGSEIASLTVTRCVVSFLSGVGGKAQVHWPLLFFLDIKVIERFLSWAVLKSFPFKTPVVKQNNSN